jgi:hypothetical protein
MRRSQTLRNTRSSVPGNSGLARPVDDLGVVHEDRATAPPNIDNLEASLRSEVFEKGRDNDKVHQVARLHCISNLG